jgi:hypothetical protein
MTNSQILAYAAPAIAATAMMLVAWATYLRLQRRQAQRKALKTSIYPKDGAAVIENGAGEIWFRASKEQVIALQSEAFRKPVTTEEPNSR